MTVQTVAIDDNQTVEMVSKKYDDVEVFYVRETGEGTVFWNDLVIECKVTAAINLMLCRLENAEFFEKVTILQQIQRTGRIVEKILKS